MPRNLFKESPITVRVVIAVNRSYAFTLRKVKNPETVDKYDYNNHLTKLQSKGMSIKRLAFETPSGLHVHGVCLLPEGFDFKVLRFRGWHLLLTEIYDEIGWLKYIQKEDDEYDRMLQLAKYAQEQIDKTTCEPST